MTMLRVVIPGPSVREERRWQPVDNLCCPVCRRAVQARAPGYWKVADGPVPAWSHRDGQALCRIRTDDGIRLVDPVPRSTTRPPQAERRGGPSAPQRT